MISGQDVAAQALLYLGAPYLHKGRSRNGLDCIGLAIVVGKDLGLLSVESEPDYGEPPDPDALRAAMDAYTVPASIDAVGSILLFRFVREPQHVAIRTEYGIVHCYARAGRVVQTTFDASWRKRFISAHKFKGQM